MVQALRDLEIGAGERCGLCQMNGIRLGLGSRVNQEHSACPGWQRYRHCRAPEAGNETHHVFGCGHEGRTVAGTDYGIDFAFFRGSDPRFMGDGIEKSMAQNRRVILISCAMIAAGLIG